MADSDSETWSTKEVIADLKTDLVGRFDKQDIRLESIDRRVDTTATKADIRVLTDRVDGHDRRIGSLEQYREADEAVNAHRRFTSTQRWVALGVFGTATGAVVAGLIDAHVIF